MRVVKKFGLATHVSFDGDAKAVDTLTAIHKELSDRGYGIDIPEAVGESNELSLPGIGAVRVTLVSLPDVREHTKHVCSVELLQGAIASRIAQVLG